MKQIIKKLSLIIATPLLLVGLAAAPVAALSAANADAAQQARLQAIITRGNTEIDRRLKTLGTVGDKITSNTRLSAENKASLSSELAAEIEGLTNLKTTLNGQTNVTDAKASAQSIFEGYRVYALIVPKVLLLKTADSQQITEARLTTLATKLQTAITTQQTAGKDVAALQTKLDDMTAKTKAAQTISDAVEAKVAPLEPSDYNSDHTILVGQRDQLKVAQAYLVAAIADAKDIISGLKAL